MKSAYELKRDATIAANREKLVHLGLERVVPSTTKQERKPRTTSTVKAEPTRASKRGRAPAPDPLPLPEDNEPPPKRSRPARPPPATAETPLIDNVRRYIEENVPDDHELEERRMFGMVMWLVRGNMFLGVGTTSGRMLVRVGEPHTQSLLDDHPEGVRRCSSSANRTFPGTLIVESPQFRGEEQMAFWFAQAMRHNASMAAKEPSAKPRKKAKTSSAAAAAASVPEEETEEAATTVSKAPPRRRKITSSAAATFAAPVPEQMAEEAVGEAAREVAGEAAEEAPPKRRPASTSGGQFAKCVLHVIKSIPRGRVASYGQVAMLAGAPRNARQVGSMLKEGLCWGGMPWWRVLGSSGKSSLPANAGGNTQRENLTAEGVMFRDSGVVDPRMWLARTAPFFV